MPATTSTLFQRSSTNAVRQYEFLQEIAVRESATNIYGQILCGCRVLVDESHLIYTLEAAPLPSAYVPESSFVHVNVLQELLICSKRADLDRTGGWT